VTVVDDEVGNPEAPVRSRRQAENEKRSKSKARVTVQHTDIIQDEFWERRPWLLSNKPGKIPKETSE
jgi:tRNA(His) guanylyltransferase